jgi:hypothetical protein
MIWIGTQGCPHAGEEIKRFGQTPQLSFANLSPPPFTRDILNLTNKLLLKRSSKDPACYHSPELLNQIIRVTLRNMAITTYSMWVSGQEKPGQGELLVWREIVLES